MTCIHVCYAGDWLVSIAPAPSAVAGSVDLGTAAGGFASVDISTSIISLSEAPRLKYIDAKTAGNPNAEQTKKIRCLQVTQHVIMTEEQ